MASIRKHRNGYRAEVARLGVRRSKVFSTKQAAKDWASRQEYLILHGDKAAAVIPFSDILDRYAREVSPGKRGHRWEVVRLERIRRDTIAKRPIGSLTAQDFADWRDRRLGEVSPSSVRREMILLSAVLTQARKEWGLISVSPMKDVRKPVDAPPRERRVARDEIDRLAHVAGADLSNATARAFHAFLFAIETAMRAGEVLSLSSDAVDVSRRVARLARTKNGTAREVPLSIEAVRLWEALPGDGFDLSSAQLDALWRKIRDKAGVRDLRFHDARHEAITRLSRRLDPLALARAVGHRDIRMLMIYYDESAEDLARRLD